MTREEKITMVAAVTNHSEKFIAEMVEGNDQQLENLMMIAKATINQDVSEAAFELMS